ncbi:MAG: PorP/SprF family type IX secretion system membrane protein [Bacteroidota bacterium]|nr:PorP/SprF family type IX secretion system membrane protein [Bacteroidota bacterium]
MKKALYILILFSLSFGIKAQQIGMYNHYFYKPLFYNPAFAGNSQVTEAMMINRSQWSDFNGAPQLNILMLDGIIKEKKAGLGLTLLSDKRGINKRNGGNVSYSYRANFNEDMYLLLGLSAGLVNQTIDYSRAVSENYNDPTLFVTQQQKTSFDGNAGFAFVWKGLEVAASAPQLLGNKINYVDNTSGVKAYYTQLRHYVSSVKYKITIIEDKGISVAPQALVRIVPGAPFQYDGNINFDWKDKFWIGGSYKSNYAASVNAGVCIHKQLNIGYSYEFIMGNLASYSGISHELMVSYKFGKGKKSDEPDTAYLAQQAKNELYEHRIDSMHTELSENQQKINENQQKIKDLTARLEQMKIQQQQLKDQQTAIQNNVANNAVNTNQQNNNNQNATNNNSGQNISNNTNPPVNNTITNNTGTQNNANQNAAVVNENVNKVMDGNVWVVTAPATGFKNAANATPKAGYYVVVGTFVYQDFAEAEVKRFKSKGFASTGWMFSGSHQYNYVYIKKVNSKEEAMKTVKEAKSAGVNDAWVQILE